jgi:hypothetical protein
MNMCFPTNPIKLIKILQPHKKLPKLIKAMKKSNTTIFVMKWKPFEKLFKGKTTLG